MNREIKIKISELEETSFQRYGKIIRIPVFGTKKPLLSSSFFNHYGPLALIACEGNFELGITTFQKRPLVVDELEQHAETAEMLYAIDADMIIPIAAIIIRDGVAVPDESTFTAMHVKQGEGVVFNEGIWHWAPFPFGDKDFSSVLVGFKQHTAEKDIIIKELDYRYILE